MKLFKFKPYLILTAVLLALAAMTFGSQRASALSGSDFQAGRIMDDSVFFNPDTMTPTQIQEFLNAKVPVCDTNGTQPYGGTTRASYSTSRGNPPPFICLKDYTQDTSLKTSDLYCNAVGGGLKSSAQIIHEVSKACGINPKVLIVLLQKEQSLVTDDWPWPIQYRSATGYGCPDTAPCDAEYYGFFNQVYMAARQFKRYAALSANYNYRKDRNNYVQYNPNAGCGGSNVFITNQATAGLYNYTPYQPNAAALNNLYGTGDGCSAYGNRNFWRMYNDWFGSTFAPSYSWQIVSQYTDKDMANLRSGDKVTFGFTARNTGNATWTSTGANPIRVGTVAPLERTSAFRDASWLGATRPVALKEASVAPGGVGTFEFIGTVPNQPGVYNERFGLLAEGLIWLNDLGLSYYARVVPDTFSWQMTGQYANKDMANLRAGEQVLVGFTAKNTGNTTWSNAGSNPIRVGTLGPIERRSIFASGSNWLGVSRPVALKEASVAPGGVGTFELLMTVPAQPGVYNERFGLLAEGRTWLNDIGLSYYARILPDTFSWQMTGQYANKDMANLRAGEQVLVGFTARNTGNVTWTNNGPNPMRVGTLSPVERSSIFAPGSNWLGTSRPAALKETSVPPGSIGTFEFLMTVPNKPGIYNERFGLLAEGRTWLNDIGLSYYARIVQ